MHADKKIDYLELPAGNFDAVQSFYEEAFGWSFTDYRAFTDGNSDGGSCKSELRSTTENGAVLVVLYAEGLERTRETILAAGGVIVKEFFSFPGGRRFHFAGSSPDRVGSRAEFIRPIMTPVVKAEVSGSERGWFGKLALTPIGTAGG